MKERWILIICLTCGPWLCAQNQFSGELLPKVIFNGRFDQRLAWTIAADAEVTWLRKSARMPAALGFTLTDLNLQLGLDYRLTTTLNLAGGYQFGIDDIDQTDLDFEHRLLQQISLAFRPGKIRLQGRLRTEQRFFKKNSFQIAHRLRNRLSADFPLQGQQLDPGETYLNTNSEWLFPLSNKQPVFFTEVRNYLGIGWRLHSGGRLENGLEWRTRALNTDGDRRHNLFWRLTWTP